MVREVLQTPRVRPHTTTISQHRQDVLIPATQILRMSRANSLGQGSAKLERLAPSHTRLMSQPSIRLVNTLPRYEGPKSRTPRPCTDSSARATASSEQSAHWHTFFQMEEGSIDRAYLLGGSSISAADWILNYTSSQTPLWHTHCWLSKQTELHYLLVIRSLHMRRMSTPCNRSFTITCQ